MLLLSELAVIFAAALTTAAGALWWYNGRTPTTKTRDAMDVPEPVMLMFDGPALVQATVPAMSMLGLEPGMHEWADLHDKVTDQFPDFPAQGYQGESGHITLSARQTNGLTQALIRWEGTRCWVTFAMPVGAGLSEVEQKELHALRRVSDTATSPVWQTDQNGNIIWHNAAFASLKSKLTETGSDRSLFDSEGRDLPERVEVTDANTGQTEWYEVDALCIDNITIYRARCITPILAAERAQRNFVQTLTKTFAHLQTALAIFDRKGQLALFNPALVDLTGLSAQFLSARPTILSFFDALRENRRMPEPKNYLSWRQEIAELIAAATDGSYSETWSLESGQTYSVQGRPHPDGATAFVIEDVSAEVTLTRNFRAELELSQSLLDTIPEALAVFSPTGLLTFCNQAYKDMWGVNPDTTFIDITVADSVTEWRRKSMPNTRWAEIETSVLTYGHRESWSMSIALSSGPEVICEIVPIAAAATLVRFSELPQETIQTAQVLLPAG